MYGETDGAPERSSRVKALVLLIFGAIFIVGVLFVVPMVSSGLGKLDSAANELEYKPSKEKITAATSNFDPAPEWTQLANVMKAPEACDFFTGWRDCAMYSASWDTHLPLDEYTAAEISGRFVGDSFADLSCDAKMTECTKSITLDGVVFDLRMTSIDEGRSAIVMVEADKP